MTDCLSCRHASPATDPSGRVDFSKKICKVDPPTPLLMPDGRGGAMIQSFHPLVGKGVWCSKHDDPVGRSANAFNAAKAILEKLNPEGWDQDDVNAAAAIIEGMPR